ncbi:MAM and LDL-receptor class A domain-containing protein 1 [Paroedura picta]|uniref:MAM and LDL-receptor class A domain-containing protein 1 n=1 Tax=Paroedura picta TaxID=143630 RepID=UPI004055ACD4
MIKVSIFGALLCFSLAVLCPSKEGFQCGGSSLVSSKEACGFTNQSKDSSDEYSYCERCDFENDCCYILGNGRLPSGWIRRNGLSIKGPPFFDHNRNNSAFFLTLSSEWFPYPSVLRSKAFSVASYQLTCQISFYYWIGQINGTLTVGLQTLSDETVKTIWQQTEGIKNQWQNAVIAFNSTQDLEVVIQGQIFESWTTGETIAIDDLSVTGECFQTKAHEASLCKEHHADHNESCIPEGNHCPNVSSISSGDTRGGFCFQDPCSFKIHICGRSSSDSAERLRKESQDLGFNSFLLKDGSNDTNGQHECMQGNESTLHASIQLNDSMCRGFEENCQFQFDYLLVERGVLKAAFYTAKDEPLMLWKASATTKNEWVKVKIQLPAGVEKGKLVLEGTTQSKISSICLDNFRFMDNKIPELPTVCSAEEFACANGHCIDSTLACDYQLDCLDGSDESSAACANYTVCDFESKQLCEWKTLSNKDVPWAVTEGQTFPGLGFPTRDHTTNSDKGNFIYMTGLPTYKKPIISHLSSPVFAELSTVAAHCQVRFWYQLSQDSQLTVSIRTPGNSEILLNTHFFESKRQWTKATVLIKNTTGEMAGPFQYFCNNYSSSISQIAQLQSPKFSQAASGCTMTFWYYNYGQSVGAAEMQLLVDGRKDPTVLWRIYYNQGDQWLKAFIQLGRLPQPFQLSLNKVSLGFYDGVSAIDDIRFENCALPPPALNCESPDRFWCQESKACIDRLFLCDLVDDCGDGSDEDNCMAALQCNFESGLCNWKQDTDDDFDWTRNQGPTPTLNTGPMKDHTLGTVKGHYLYLESSEPQEFQNRAVLLSPLFNSTFAENRRSCIFRFHYHMFGKHIYRLAVFQRTASNTRGHLLWHMFGNQGNRWIRKILYITSSEPFQILVEGTVGDGFTGDIGIDDLSFMDCTLYYGNLTADSTTPLGTSIPVTLPMNNCTKEEFICRATGQCIKIIQRCDFRPDCSDKSDESSCVSEACDFDNQSLCEWYQPAVTMPTISAANTANVFQWGLGKGATIHPGEGNHRPSIDHSKATEEGWYLYADSSNGEFRHTADLLTPVISLTGPKCKLVFWNYMNGPTVGSLQVLSKVGNVTSELWAQSGPQGPQWNRAEVFLGIRSYFQVVLRARRGISYVGDVAVDDISFEDCSAMQIPVRHCTSEEFTCANKYCIPKDNLCDFVNDCADNSDESQSICGTSIGRCDFEFDLCDWEQEHTDNFDWNLRIGGISRAGTQPIADHTSQKPSGHYIFIKSSFPQLPGQEARISSVVISKRSRNCKLVFYYHMYGVNMGSLTVYQVMASNSKKVLLNLTGNQGNFWTRKVLPLEADEDFQVTFEGCVGKGRRGDIALDDITFTKECLLSSDFFPDVPTALPPTGSCSQGFLECLNGNCYRPEQSCNFVDDCGDNTDERECGTSCTFESGICGWQNSAADNFEWLLGTSSPQILRPPKDHTLGNGKGHFLYLEATSVGVRGEKAHLKSSKWKESSTTCGLSFWYYTSSKATGQIQLLIKVEHGLVKKWNDSGISAGQWKRAEIHLGKLRNFEVIFEGIRAKDLGGGAAIDDIEYKNCSTIGEDSGVCPTVSDFVCWNKNCIESHLVCDYKSDCGDQSDEADCSQYTSVPGSCNFEMQGQDWATTCGYTQDSDDDFDWHVSNKTVTQGEGPSKGHTPGNGHTFLYINSSSQQEGDRARIVTATYFPASLDICRLRFWFWPCHSALIGVLKVYIVEEFGMDILMWSATGKKRKAWTYASVALSSYSPFRVAFEAEVGAKEILEFALDDISFTPECLLGGPVSPQPPTCPTDQFTCMYVKQCVPLSAKCDQVEDCADGSDEMNCPTEQPTTEPLRHCKDTEFQCGNQLCIPSLLRCDGVTDCPFNEDEANCPIKDCFNGSLLCPSTNSCIPVSQRCDGIVDCIDFFLDESSCSVCPESYCKNGGICNKETVPLCRCEEEWKGNRCHIKVRPPLTAFSGFFKNDIWTGLSVGLALLLIEIAVAVSCILSKRKLPRTKPEELLNTAFANPLYEAHSVKSAGYAASLGVQISVSPWQAQQGPFYSNDIMAASFANPLYGTSTEKWGDAVKCP